MRRDLIYRKMSITMLDEARSMALAHSTLDPMASLRTALASLHLYVWEGVQPGSQLDAMLRNDLRDTFACADECRRFLVPALVGILYNDLPGACWGSDERVRDWMALDRAERHRLVGAFLAGRGRDFWLVAEEEQSSESV